MRKIALLLGGMLLAGCLQVDNYNQVVKVPAPAGIAGYWQSSGPQSELVSPQAIASLVVTPQGDTLDCRQWQRVTALHGKLMVRDNTLYNVTQKREIYPGWGQCMVGSLTGAVSSQSVTEEFEGTLNTVGNRVDSALA